MKMNLYLLKRIDYDEDQVPYDEYNAIVVASTSIKDALTISPSDISSRPQYTWTTPDNIECIYLGVAKKFTKRGIILKSFNAR